MPSDSDPGLDARVAALLRGPLEDFVERRKALAAELKGEGRKEDAARVAKIAKPALAAWIVNRAVAERAQAIDALLACGLCVRKLYGEAFRQGMPPKSLAQAQREEREATDQLVAQAGETLAREGTPLSAANAEKLRVTLSAIALTGRFGDEGRGLMTRELATPSLDEVLAALGEAPLERPPANDVMRPAPAPAPKTAGAPPRAEEEARRAEEAARAEEAERARAAEREAARLREARLRENERRTAEAQTRLAEHGKQLEIERRAHSHLTGRIEALRLEIGRLESSRGVTEQRMEEIERETRELRESIQALARERLAIV